MTSSARFTSCVGDEGRAENHSAGGPGRRRLTPLDCLQPEMEVLTFTPPLPPAHRPGTSTSAIRLLTIGEASVILGVSGVTVRRRVRSGALPHIRISSRLYFKLAKLNAFVEAHRGHPDI